ncbi:TIGR03088 family PEP-CTERM/XrtA system glycosyltransferase [Scleromatobacter humisilvae]|uniref:TIGR03088 family PEP-CTERM/XrtA system glycosyltransferase n=1 Tax=Scleromatobacter humisilvae TaxID=2897159 RepID=A0A9X1YK50_9BURK|nr:TIGR03088 family PEP-CTERM/XrtA system glycosyltransferase [Scleromatobacter humisilvae]MCK9686365.1 TIGR03088 family PEP-CTERM/XrtA system glycosyltransferase [Scleromatobacter humisilvae]
MTTDTRPLILHVIHHLVTGGMENGLVSLINRMPSTSYRHAIVCIEDYSDFRNRLTRPDTEVMAMRRSQIGTWRLRYQLFRTFRRLKPAIVHSRNKSGLDALLPARLAGVKHCVHGEHGWDVHDLDGRSRKEQVLRKLHAPLVERYVTVSRSLRDYLVERVGIRPERITTICNGVDTDKFHPAERKPMALLPASLQGEGRVVIGTVGRLQPVKDQQALLRAFAELVGEGGPGAASARLLIVGNGPLREALERQAQALGIAHLTTFAGDRSDVAQLLQCMDVFVLPSLAEGISNTVLEAMATGLPVLATRVGGNVELVQDGGNGALFDVGDVAALKRLLAAYLADPDTRRRHGERSRELAVESFSLKAMVDGYRGAYERLMRGH